MRNYVPKDWRCDSDRYQQMIHFCRQYGKWKTERTNITLEYRAALNGSIAVKSSSASSPVEQKSDRLMELDDKIQLVEKCCREAVKGKSYLYQALLQSVTTKTPIDNVNTQISSRQLSRYRRQFYYLLDKKLY